MIGAHLTYPALLDPAAVFGREDFDADEVDDFDRQRDPMSNMTHFLVHMLEPQTLAWALQDSPVGLAAWMLHRRAAWSDCDGDVETRFTKDELITSFALYWLTGHGVELTAVLRGLVSRTVAAVARSDAHVAGARGDRRVSP